jgi:ribonuclease P protein component
MVLFGLRAEGGESRVGITASRKVGNAVVRNRCKRRVREVFRTCPETTGETPVRVVVNVRRGLDGAEWTELEREFRRCLKSLRSRLG